MMLGHAILSGPHTRLPPTAATPPANKSKLETTFKSSNTNTMLEPKISGTGPVFLCWRNVGISKILPFCHRQTHHTGQPPKWPKCYPTAPSPMTDFCHYLAKNHATKNVIEPKWAPWARAQYRWAQRFDRSQASPPDRSCLLPSLIIIIEIDGDMI